MNHPIDMSSEIRGRRLTRRLMMKIKAKALRQGLWFKVLEGQERGLLDVTIRWVNTVRSHRMASLLTRILLKLERALNSISVTMQERGREMALRLSELALSWGNPKASNWGYDPCFQLWLGLREAVDRSIVSRSSSL